MRKVYTYSTKKLPVIIEMLEDMLNAICEKKGMWKIIELYVLVCYTEAYACFLKNYELLKFIKSDIPLNPE